LIETRQTMLDGSATLASPKCEPPSHGEELAYRAEDSMS